MLRHGQRREQTVRNGAGSSHGRLGISEGAATIVAVWSVLGRLSKMGGDCRPLSFLEKGRYISRGRTRTCDVCLRKRILTQCAVHRSRIS